VVPHKDVQCSEVSKDAVNLRVLKAQYWPQNSSIRPQLLLAKQSYCRYLQHPFKPTST